MKVGVADGVGDALGDGVAIGTGETLGDGIGVGIGVGMTTGFLTPVDFFLIQTNFPDLALHSNSPLLLFAVTPTFLQGAPLFTAAYDVGVIRTGTRRVSIAIIETKTLGRFPLQTIARIGALDMFPSCPTVYP